MDGSYWCRVRWYIIPEETASGRQPHNLRRELYRTNDFADIEVIDGLFLIVPLRLNTNGTQIVSSYSTSCLNFN